ncbi:uncharacterized protein LOC111362423 [Spodoptera litura]|uniref:Uncharacterized protein LOC111362423 n=1 Tax=Spodoptera litura TaxID=69820 RepID=A0A9J7J4P1_SPOLT|nr:uncharacterized protein LOC111362423 [Spodoptera litura]
MIFVCLQYSQTQKPAQPQALKYRDVIDIDDVRTKEKQNTRNWDPVKSFARVKYLGPDRPTIGEEKPLPPTVKPQTRFKFVRSDRPEKKTMAFQQSGNTEPQVSAQQYYKPPLDFQQIQMLEQSPQFEEYQKRKLLEAQKFIQEYQKMQEAKKQAQQTYQKPTMPPPPRPKPKPVQTYQDKYNIKHHLELQDQILSGLNPTEYSDIPRGIKTYARRKRFEVFQIL